MSRPQRRARGCTEGGGLRDVVQVGLGFFEEDGDFGLDLGGGGEGALEGDGLKGEAAGATEAAVLVVVDGKGERMSRSQLVCVETPQSCSKTSTRHAVSLSPVKLSAHTVHPTFMYSPRALQLALPPGNLPVVILLLHIPKKAGGSPPSGSNAAARRDLGTGGRRGRGGAGGGTPRKDGGLCSGR